MTLVSTVLTDVSYDLKLSATQKTSRTAELINYMNRVIKNGILPTLIRFESDFGMKDWTTTETVANQRDYALPSDFVAFEALYSIDRTYGGTLASAASATSVVFASGASTSDDTYNGELFRLTSGSITGQVPILDYTGSSLTATLGSGLSGTPSTETFNIFNQPEEATELGQLPIRRLLNEFNAISDPEAFAIDRNTNVVLGNVPDDATHNLYGKYYNMPDLLTTSTNTLPYDEMFDEIVRQYTTIIGETRDEYDASFEASVYGNIQADVISVIRSRGGKMPGVTQSRIQEWDGYYGRSYK